MSDLGSVGMPGYAGAADLVDLADAMRSRTGRASDADGRGALDELVRIAVERVPQARWASLTVLRHDRFTTEAATDDTARRADLLQYEIGCGPSVDAVALGAVYLTGDVAVDERWVTWGRRVDEELGVRSVLAQRLTLLEESEAFGALTIYSHRGNAFDDHAVGLGLVLSTHGSLLVTAMLARGQATNLMKALETNREIGVAMGILMQRHQVSRDEAFDLLRVASQGSNRKLSAVAHDVTDTGILPGPGTPGASPHGSPGS